VGIISKKRYILLNKQKEFISKTQHRYFKTSTLKVNLFNFWDEHLLIDDKVIKSKKHYIDLKKRVCECGNFLDFNTAKKLYYQYPLDYLEFEVIYIRNY